MAAGHVIWTELNTHDVEAAKRWFGQTQGWSFEGVPRSDGTYWLAKQGDAIVAGLFQLPPVKPYTDMPEHWFSYFEVDDTDRHVDTVRAAGGAIRKEPFDVPGTGRIAIVQASTGAVYGIITPLPM